MNLDILNIEHYRVTSHGGRSFDLFNRESDKVYTISKDDYSYIKADQTVGRCFDVETWNSSQKTR